MTHDEMNERIIRPLLIGESDENYEKNVRAANERLAELSYDDLLKEIESFPPEYQEKIRIFESNLENLQQEHEDQGGLTQA